MAFQSMTGFSQCSFRDNLVDIQIELRSVNGKGLDFRIRLPAEFVHLEAVLRKKINQKIQRGTIQGVLNLSCDDAQAVPVINEAVLQNYFETAGRFAEQNKLAPPSVEHLMALPGVVQFNNEQGTNLKDEACQKAIGEQLDVIFDKAILGLVESRQQEGAALIAILQEKLDFLAKLLKKAKSDDSLNAENMRERLKTQMSMLIDKDGKSSDLDGDRLYQEVAILINRSDVKEELDRLDAHLLAIGELLAPIKMLGEPIGKKLDFLAQELNREANTLCSKSISPSLSAVGIELKTTIDQFREQVQNLQ